MRFALTTLCCLSLVFGLLAQEPIVDPVKIVRRALEAHGGEKALQKYPGRAVEFEGTITLVGERYKVKSRAAYHLPDKSNDYMELVDKKSAVEVVMNQDKIQQTVNGKIEELKDDKLKSEYRFNLALQEVSQFFPLLDAKVYTLKANGTQKVGNQTLDLIDVSKKDLRDVTLGFDQDNGRLVLVRYKTLNPLNFAEEVLQETIQSDFQIYSGLLLPTKLAMTHDGKEFMKLTVKDVRLFEMLDEKLFTINPR